MTLGLGRDALVRDRRRTSASRCDPDALAAAIAADRAAGHRPIAIVATVGTTSSTSVDPVAAIADIAEREGLWLHVDSAYAGVVAMLPGATGAVRGLGARRFDRREPAQVAVHAARRVAAADAAGWPSCARRSASCPSTCARSTATTPVRDYNEYTPQLGRRFRALKLWIQLRWFGLEGLRRRIERPPRAGRRVRGAGRRATRTGSGWRPSRSRRSASAGDPAGWSGHATRRSTRPNAAIMDAVNRTGEVFLSHTRLDGRFTIRVAVGNLRTEARHVERAWELLREAAAGVSAPREARPTRRPVLRDARRSCATGSTPTTRPPPSSGSGYYRKATGRPSVAGREAVDEALCVGWIDGIRNRLDDTRSRPAVHAAAQGQQLERDQRRQGGGADRPRAGCGRPGLAAFEARTDGEDRRSTRTSGRRGVQPTRRPRVPGRCRPPGRTGSGGRRRIARAVHALGRRARSRRRDARAAARRADRGLARPGRQVGPMRWARESDVTPEIDAALDAAVERPAGAGPRRRVRPAGGRGDRRRPGCTG